MKHDWHRPMGDDPNADVVYASIPPKYQWKCSKCGEVVYLSCPEGEPKDDGCEGVAAASDAKVAPANNVALLNPDGTCPPLPEFETTGASTLNGFETLVVNGATGDYHVETDWEAKCKHLQSALGDVEDQLHATKQELRLTRAQLSNTLNNWEQAKGKLRRQEEELERRRKNLDARDEMTADKRAHEKIEYWRRRAKDARAEAEGYREKLSKVLDVIQEADSIARR